MLNADARAIPLADRSVHCVVTSPPYWGLRDYGIAGQLGLEPTPEEYVANMVAVFREVWRVLRDDGTLWLNLGDCYCPENRGENAKPRKEYPAGLQAIHMHSDLPTRRDSIRAIKAAGIKAKDLVGIPWRVAFALQADGWYLRSDVIWSKPNPMPESVTDRPTKAHEYLFLLAKRERYYYDAEAIKELGSTNSHGALNGDPGEKARITGNHSGPLGLVPVDGKRNRRTVWEIATQPYPEAHFATFPEALVEPCILASTSERGCCPTCGDGWERVVDKARTFESGSGRSGNLPVGKNGAGLQGGGETGDVRRGPVVHATTAGWQPTCACGASTTTPPLVLDPFAGSGTVGLVCHRLGRRFVGLELKPAYCALAYRRTAQLGLV